MKQLKFSCRLLSDIIINQKAATEGPNKTLDYIPGSNFLGIVAAQYYKFDERGLAAEVFHSGKVRFGDAHPAHSNVRTSRVPLSMYYPKLKKASEVCYIHHLIPEGSIMEQLKQCRSGFYDFSTKAAIQEATLVKSQTTFAIKSAHNKMERRSKEGQLYGYESLQAGLELYFEVEVDNDCLADAICDALVGEKRVGRSRTAQYGLVSIKEATYTEVVSKTSTETIHTVYADSRLIFLDKTTGLPTFQPTAADLGFADGEINWEKSQLRTFQYAPWNYHRQCFDTDRCGIEKGSVFVIEGATASPSCSIYIGSYRNEGFGKVIYNAPFLAADEQGSAKYKLRETEDNCSKKEKTALSGSSLLLYVAQKQVEEERERNIYKLVNEWITNIGSKKGFSSDSFASQWGTVRSIAMQYRTKAELEKHLYADKNKGYLTHGVAKEKWEESGRLRALQNFVTELDDSTAQLALINLAAEMAKKCKKTKKE